MKEKSGEHVQQREGDERRKVLCWHLGILSATSRGKYELTTCLLTTKKKKKKKEREKKKKRLFESIF